MPLSQTKPGKLVADLDPVRFSTNATRTNERTKIASVEVKLNLLTITQITSRCLIGQKWKCFLEVLEVQVRIKTAKL